LWLHSEVGHTQDAKKELVSVLDFERSEDVFNTVKPTSLIRHVLQIATDKDSIILDSFAGSGTQGKIIKIIQISISYKLKNDACFSPGGGCSETC